MIEQIKLKNNRVLNIDYDESPESPRDCDNITRLAVKLNRYNLPNETELNLDKYESIDDLRDAIMETYKPIMIKEVYAYQHSNIELHTKDTNNELKSQFVHSAWDSSFIGFVFITEKDLETLGITDKTNENLSKIIEYDLKIYSQYLNGEVYQFQIVETTYCEHCNNYNEEILDSCCGYYDIEDIKEEYKDELMIE